MLLIKLGSNRCHFRGNIPALPRALTRLGGVATVHGSAAGALPGWSGSTVDSLHFFLSFHNVWCRVEKAENSVVKGRHQHVANGRISYSGRPLAAGGRWSDKPEPGLDRLTGDPAHARTHARSPTANTASWGALLHYNEPPALNHVVK